MNISVPIPKFALGDMVYFRDVVEPMRITYIHFYHGDGTPLLAAWYDVASDKRSHRVIHEQYLTSASDVEPQAVPLIQNDALRDRHACFIMAMCIFNLLMFVIVTVVQLCIVVDSFTHP